MEAANMTRQTVYTMFTSLCIGLIAQAAISLPSPFQDLENSGRMATEAPSGFRTPTLQRHQGSRSVSNGIPEPAGDTFATDQRRFEEEKGVDTGLGPTFNARSCVDCHQSPVTGGPSQFSEMRAGLHDQNGDFAFPSIPVDRGNQTIGGRDVVNDRAICPLAQEHVQPQDKIQVLRASLNTLGDGFVEAIPDQSLIDIAQRQPILSNGVIKGIVVRVPILEAPGSTRVGRFGWKDQHASLLSFSADASLNEMGITSRLEPHDVTTLCKTTQDPEDRPDKLGMEAIDHDAQFMRGTMAPPQDPVLAATTEAKAGEKIFANIGCNICHVESIVTGHAGTVINGGTFTIPAALGDKIIHPFSDFLLHKVDKDGIPPLPQDPHFDLSDWLRTSPLWGLRTKTRYMHDQHSKTLEGAIQRHCCESEQSTENFRQLSKEQQQELIAFLNSL
jgi:CxxC motif-containing protein (DUF1111 family)